MARLKRPRPPLTPGQESLRLAQRYSELCADFGGEEQLSTLQRQLLRRAALLTLRGEIADLDIASGRPIDMQRYVSECAMLLRILSRLGARATPQPATPQSTLRDYLQAREGKQPVLASETGPTARPKPPADDGKLKSAPSPPATTGPDVALGPPTEAIAAAPS